MSKEQNDRRLERMGINLPKKRENNNFTINVDPSITTDGTYYRIIPWYTTTDFVYSDSSS